MNKKKPLDWAETTDHPIIVRTCHSTTGGMSFEAGSPHLVGDSRDIFLSALRDDVSLFTIERARPTFRDIPPDEPTIPPETCTPYTDANGFGYYLKNTLPLVFVNTRRGELLPDARVAIKYMRENSSEFSEVLATLEKYSSRIFKPGEYSKLHTEYPVLFSDVAQPYAAFTNIHMAMRTGCYLKTQPGVATILGPPINQKPVIPLHSGLMETEWYHSELFIVFDGPKFTDSVFVIKPDTVIAQFYFVSKRANDNSEIVFEKTDLGATEKYRKRSIEVGRELVRKGTNVVISKATGVKSLSVSCPHCWVSITNAAENGVSDDHIQIHDFYQGYKMLRSEYRRDHSEKDAGSSKKMVKGY